MERRAVWSPEVERAVEEVNADLRALATDGVLVLDAWTLLSDKGRLRDGYPADTLHLTDGGYDALNAELEKRLRLLAPKGKGEGDRREQGDNPAMR